jgi:hypothetical protein
VQVDFLDDEFGATFAKSTHARAPGGKWYWSHPAAFYALWCGLLLQFAVCFAIAISVPKSDQWGYFAVLFSAYVVPYNLLAGFLAGRYVKPRNRSRSRSDGPPACSNCGEPRLRFVASVIATWKCPHCGSRGFGKWGKRKHRPIFDPDF